MKFTVRKVSDYKNKWEVEIYTIEELEKLQKEYKNPLVIDFDGFINNGPEIRIYDDYME